MTLSTEVCAPASLLCVSRACTQGCHVCPVERKAAGFAVYPRVCGGTVDADAVAGYRGGSCPRDTADDGGCATNLGDASRFCWLDAQEIDLEGIEIANDYDWTLD